MRSNHHIALSRISNDMNFFYNVKTFLFSLGNTTWLDPLVERTYLETINVTTNNLNIRMELLEEKLAADNKQVLMSWQRADSRGFSGFFLGNFENLWCLIICLQHVRLLRSLCEGLIYLPPLEGGSSGLTENRYYLTVNLAVYFHMLSLIQIQSRQFFTGFHKNQYHPHNGHIRTYWLQLGYAVV